MRKEDKDIIIAQIADTVKNYSCFYLVETAGLNAEKTSDLRRVAVRIRFFTRRSNHLRMPKRILNSIPA